jgi:hypothetical protein
MPEQSLRREDAQVSKHAQVSIYILHNIEESILTNSCQTLLLSTFTPYLLRRLPCVSRIRKQVKYRIKTCCTPLGFHRPVVSAGVACQGMLGHTMLVPLAVALGRPCVRSELIAVVCDCCIDQSFVAVSAIARLLQPCWKAWMVTASCVTRLDASALLYGQTCYTCYTCYMARQQLRMHLCIH